MVERMLSTRSLEEGENIPGHALLRLYVGDQGKDAADETGLMICSTSCRM